MRKIIIDTDTGSDDAIAILMALRDPSVQVLAVTTVCGNVNMEQATINAFRSIDAARTYVPPVYKGAFRPLYWDLVTGQFAHGQDGMGDMGLPVPDMQPETEHAVEAILRLVKENPGEIEIVALGPATNLALAMMKDPETMKQVKHIYSMGSGGYGKGNATSVAEFNVFVDAEAYKVLVDFPVPLTIIGLDLCYLPDALITQQDIDQLQTEGPIAQFAVDCNATLFQFCSRVLGRPAFIQPDPLAMGAALCPDIVTEVQDCYCFVCTDRNPTYGQVVVEPKHYHKADEAKLGSWKPTAAVVKQMDMAAYKQKLHAILKI